LGTKERREREREEIRTKILEAARELFASEGYEAVTMRRIAEKIEYSPTAIYLHFKDKRAVLVELCDLDFLSLAKELHKIGRIEDPIERLRRTGEAYVRFGLEYPNHYRLMFMTPHPEQMEDDSRIARGNPEEDAWAFLRDTVAEAIAAGRLRPEVQDPDLVAQAFWAAVHGVISLRIAKCNDDWIDWRPVPDVAGLLVEAALRGLLRDGEGA
jgi:AcrR family transcriptional regulator